MLETFGLGVPILTKVIIDRIIPLSLTSIVPILSIFVLSLCLAQLVIMVLRAFLLTYLQYRIDMYTYPNFFDHLFMLPLKFFQQRSTGDILTRVSSNNTIRDIVSTQFLSTILDGSLVVVYLLILLWQSWLFALVVLILGILQLAFLLGANNEYRLRSARELETIGKSQGYVAEILAGITTVKAAGAEQRVFQWWFNLFSDQLSASLRRSYLASFLSIVYQSTAYCLSASAPLVRGNSGAQWDHATRHDDCAQFSGRGFHNSIGLVSFECNSTANHLFASRSLAM